MRPDWRALRGVVWDWGDTLMRDIPGQPGPMASWPHVEAMPGAAAALEALSHLPARCVATNAADSDSAAVAEALGRVGLRSRLTHVFTSKELGVGKPDPGFFRAVAQRLGVPPEALLAVGNDLGKDVVPARAAGLATVWVAAVGAADPSGAADLVVPDLAELARIARAS